MVQQRSKRRARRIRIALLSLVVLFAAIQLVPYGRDHTNPRVIEEPPWISAEARRVAVTACFDCHSNETRWPWYSNVAPVSWFIQGDVDEGREALNFSEWNRSQPDANESEDTIRDGEMPPRFYLLLHPDAALSDDDQELLIRAITVFAPRGSDD
jgi:hypothetical protein